MKNVVLGLTSALLTFVVLEFGARVYLEHIASEPTFLSFASYRQLEKRYGSEARGGTALKQIYSPHRYLGFYPSPNYRWGENRHNSLGYRGDDIPVPKPEGEFRIFCIGGSTTYTSDIEDPTLSYPSLLEKDLRERGYENVRVINAAAASWTSWESLVNFQLRVLDLEPDLIVIYHAINDVHARIVWPPEAYRADNSGWRAPNHSGVFMPSPAEYSTLLRILMIRAGWIGAHADLTRTIDPASPTYYAEVFRSQVRNGTYPEGIFETVSAAKMLEANPPVYFARNIGNLTAIAKRHDVGVVIATFAYSREFEDEPRVTSPEYIKALGDHNAVLKEVATAEQAALFDFAAVFPTDARFFSDGRHVNEEGSRLKARLFADFLVASDLVPDQRP